MDPSLQAPQSSGPSRQHEVPQLPMTNTGTWQGPQRLMHFRDPLYKWGHRGAERGMHLVPDVRAGSWRVSFSQSRLWGSEPGDCCVVRLCARERATWLVPFLQASKPVRHNFLGTLVVSLMQRENLMHREVK